MPVTQPKAPSCRLVPRGNRSRPSSSLNKSDRPCLQNALKPTAEVVAVAMADQPKTTPTLPPKQMESSPPNSHQAVKFMAAATIGALLLVLSGLTLAGTVISLVVATPVLVLFSPILVPAGIVITMVVLGFFFSFGFGVASLSALSSIYNYVAEKHPPGADQLDYARMRLANKARDVKEKAKEYGQSLQKKALEVTQGSN